jgi:hypothetical protein
MARSNWPIASRASWTLPLDRSATLQERQVRIEIGRALSRQPAARIGVDAQRECLGDRHRDFVLHRKHVSGARSNRIDQSCRPVVASMSCAVTRSRNGALCTLPPNR